MIGVDTFYKKYFFLWEDPYSSLFPGNLSSIFVFFPFSMNPDYCT